MNRQSFCWCLVFTFFAVVGCSKSPREMTCSDTEVQLNVRKLLAMNVQDWQQPTQEGAVGASDYLRRSAPEAAAALNGFRARSVSPQSVRLAEMREVAAPTEPLQDVEPASDGRRIPEMLRNKPTGNKLLYQCAATAHIQIPKDIVQALPASNRSALGLDEDGINAAIFYRTELTPDGKLWVATGFAQPLIEVSLRALFSQRAAAEVHQ